MKSLKFKKIDAFASNQSSGNPAGVIYFDNKDELNDKEMLQIAKELEGFVNEVGYIWQQNNGYGLRYYSSEREVEFCGHATIAIMYDLIKNNVLLFKEPRVTIYTKNDTLVVENKIASDDAVFVTAPSPKFRTLDILEDDILKALRINNTFIDNSLDIAIVNAGLETLIVPIKDLDSILKVNPNLDELNNFCKQSNIDIIILFSKECFDKRNSYRTRVFAATFGYLEDPATGSGNSALGNYLLKRNMWNGNLISIEQNGLKYDFNTIKLTTKDIDNTMYILFGGGARIKIDGNYLL